MGNLKRIKTLLNVLPEKDRTICLEYLKQRDFEAILEIVKSDIYKTRKNHIDDIPDTYESELIKLECELISYMSVLDISDDYNDY